MPDPKAANDKTVPVQPVPPIQWGVLLIGVYQIVLSLLLLSLMFIIWPEREGAKTSWLQTIPVGNPLWKIGDDARLILIVMLTGALGSHVHAATSFATYVGNRRIRLSWAWWYVLRPFIGMAMALIFYFVVRGGLLSTGAAANDISVFGLAATAGLVGMFSKQAADKLRELFDTLFRTEQGEGDDARSDKLGGNLPVSMVMIPRHKIAAFVIPQNDSAETVKLADLHKMLGGVVTRIPVLGHDDVPVCVIHQSLLYKFLADRAMAPGGAGQPVHAGLDTLQHFLDAKGMSALVQGAVAYVRPTMLLSEAKDEMERLANCQDVLVTENGRAGEALLGWLTDAELRRAAKV